MITIREMQIDDLEQVMPGGQLFDSVDRNRIFYISDP